MGTVTNTRPQGGFPVTRETSEADGGHILSERWLNSTQGMEGEAERCHGSSFLGSVWSPGRHGTGCYGWVEIGSAGRQATCGPSGHPLGHPLISWTHVPLGPQNEALFGEIVNPFRSGALVGGSGPLWVGGTFGP